VTYLSWHARVMFGLDSNQFLLKKHKKLAWIEVFKINQKITIFCRHKSRQDWLRGPHFFNDTTLCDVIKVSTTWGPLVQEINWLEIATQKCSKWYDCTQGVAGLDWWIAQSGLLSSLIDCIVIDNPKLKLDFGFGLSIQFFHFNPNLTNQNIILIVYFLKLNNIRTKLFNWKFLNHCLIKPSLGASIVVKKKSSLISLIVIGFWFDCQSIMKSGFGLSIIYF